MTTELILLGTAGAPMPVAGGGGISSALVINDRVFVIDCGRGSPSAFVDAGLDFRRLDSVFLTHLHVDHVGIWPACSCTRGVSARPARCPLAPINRVYGPSAPETSVLPAMIPRSTATPRSIPSARSPARATLGLPARRLCLPPQCHAAGRPHAGPRPARESHRHCQIPQPGPKPTCPVVVLADDTGPRQRRQGVPRQGDSGTGLPVRHRRRIVVTFSGDTTVSDDLIALAQGADILVHQVADLDYLLQPRRDPPGALERMAALHTDVNQVGGVAERASVACELILSHYLPAEPRTRSPSRTGPRGAGAGLQRDDHRGSRRGCAGRSHPRRAKPRLPGRASWPAARSGAPERAAASISSACDHLASPSSSRRCPATQAAPPPR